MEPVAVAADRQLKAIDSLTRGAGELAGLAQQLTDAVRLIQGENGHS
jgi:hypothetical protein